MAGYLQESAGRKFRVTWLCTGINPNDVYLKERHFKFSTREEMYDWIEEIESKATVILDRPSINQMYVDNSYSDTNPVVIVTITIDGYL